MAQSSSCRFGNNYKFVHDHNAKNDDSSGSKLKDHTTDDLVVKLLSKLGLNEHFSGTMSTKRGTVSTNNTAMPSQISVSPTDANPVAYQASSPLSPDYFASPAYFGPVQYAYPPAQTYGSPTVLPIFYYPPAYHYYPVQTRSAQQPVPPYLTSPALPHTPVHGPAQQAQSESFTCQATTLPHAFTVGTLHDPTSGA
nr:hypothetical protein [Tanacetum cinerariifolium]